MPYKLKKQNGKVAIVKKDGGKVVGHSDSMEMAKKAIAARMANEHDTDHDGK